MATERHTRGGKRAGAGRKKTGRCFDTPHRKRASLSPDHAVHAVLRTVANMPRLRTARGYEAIRRVLVHFLGREDFRILQISIQHNHLHLIVEAANRRALTLNMQAFAIRVARALNRVHRRRGKVFAFRYHAKQITTARQARNTLAYVLNNWRKHREHLASARTRSAKLDPYASGLSFDGWHDLPKRLVLPAGYVPLPVSRPRTALLRFDWQLFGRIGVLEVPGPSR